MPFIFHEEFKTRVWSSGKFLVIMRIEQIPYFLVQIFYAEVFRVFQICINSSVKYLNSALTKDLSLGLYALAGRIVVS